MLTWPSKDPNEVLDYQLDWTPRLAGDTIVTSTWLVTGAQLLIANQSNTTSISTVWLSGGRELQTYQCLNRIVTAAGRTMDETVSIAIQQR